MLWLNASVIIMTPINAVIVWIKELDNWNEECRQTKVNNYKYLMCNGWFSHLSKAIQKDISFYLKVQMVQKWIRISIYLFTASFGQNHIFLYRVSSATYRPNPIFNIGTKFQFFLKSVLCRSNINDTIVESQIFKQICMFLLSLCWLCFFFGFLITNIDPVIAGHLSK